MKIIHPSGQAYDLNIDTELELTRYNPFFHDKGEQSVPITLPATDHNLALLQHPESVSGRQKIAQRLDATIQSGIYSVNARQAILSARKNDSIETSFYLREGAFYEKSKDVSLQEIFEDKSIEFATIDAAIEFMHNILATNDSRFACFQVVTDNYVLNEVAMPVKPNGFKRFIKAQETTETIDDKKITIPKGFYITPFIKIKHLLQEVLAHLGYTLAPSFLDDAPFSDMCFINDNLDTIVNNRIDYSVIVPNIMASTFFEILRKFNLELTPDEQTKRIYLTLFDDILNSSHTEVLDSYLYGELMINYPTYKQIKLTSDHLALPSELHFGAGGRTGGYSVQKGVSSDQTLSFIDILTQYPTVYLRREDGAIVRDRLKGDSFHTERVASLSLDYYAGGVLEVEEKSFPDTIPDVYISKSIRLGDVTYPYAGQGRALYSSIVMSNEEEASDDSDNAKLDAMLCFCYKTSNNTVGTLHNYSVDGDKLWNYSLMYNGADGIFEKFWRNRDNLLRNALLEVEAEMLLSERQKFMISTMNKVLLDGQEMILSEMQYAPQSDSLGICKLLTTKLQEPISTAKTESDYFPTRLYKWNKPRSTQSWTWPPGRPSGSYGFKYLSEPVSLYPPHPTQTQYNTGGRHYQKTYNVEYGEFNGRDNIFTKFGDGTLTVWLEAVLA